MQSLRKFRTVAVGVHAGVPENRRPQHLTVGGDSSECSPPNMVNSYSSKLRDPRWQKKRLEILSRDAFTCLHCGAKDKPLHVHHRYYVSDREPWEYPSFCLQTVCEECHDNIPVQWDYCRANNLPVQEDWETGMDILGEGVSWIAPQFMKKHPDFVAYHLQPHCDQASPTPCNQKASPCPASGAGPQSM